MRPYYQYETSPRKIKPEYPVSKKTTKTNSKKTVAKKKAKSKNESSKKNAQTKKNAPKENKTQKKVETKSNNNARLKFSIFVKCVLIFLVFFMIIYRNSLITQSFAKIQTLKASISELQKENNQLEINIQNSLNVNNIEQAAKEILGMQKLTNKQIIYISINKKDYVEPRTEEVIINKDVSLWESIVEKIKNIF